MVSESRTTTVRILDQEFRIRTDESAEFVESVARYVDETMRGILARMTTGTPLQAAVLAALNIAEELHRLRRDGNGAAGDTERRLLHLLQRLEEIAPAAPPVQVPASAAVRAGARG
jgi:cell division protein ZapA